MGITMDNMRKKKRLLLTSLSVQAREFFVHSTLHGVRFITSNRRFLDKIIWLCSCVGGTIAALIIIVSLWEKFQNNPTITGLDTDFHNLDVPFPALTLCQHDPSNGTLIAEYIEKHWPGASEERRAFYTGFLVALANISYASLPDLKPYLQDPSLPQQQLKQVVYEVVNRCHFLTDCIWKGEEVGDLECCPFFTPIFTENGFCYSFNLAFNESEWPFETSLGDSFKTLTIEETDLLWSLTFDTEDAQNNSIAMYISSVHDMPFYGSDPHHVWNKRIARLSFSVKETYTTDNARQLSIRQRRCVFSDEIALLTDSKYTHSACMRQCRMELASRLCGCVPFFYPPLAASSGPQTRDRFRPCALKELDCIIQNIDLFHKSTIECPCELGCMHTVYESQKLHDADPDQEEALEVGFVSWPLVRYKREVLFGWTDLLVAFGGIAGLFLGFSLLSGVEIVYYFTLRAWCMVCRDSEELERLAEEYEQAEQKELDMSLRPAFVKRSAGNAPGQDPPVGSVGELILGSQRRRKSRGWTSATLPYLP